MKLKSQRFKSFIGIVALIIILSGSGCAYLKNDKSETLSRQDKASASVIDGQETNGKLTSTEAAIEKDSLDNAHSIKF